MADKWDEVATEALLKHRRTLGPYGLLRGEDATVVDIADALREAERRGDEGGFRRGLEAAAQAADSCAWSNKNTQFLGPEQNCLRVAAAIRAIPYTPPATEENCPRHVASASDPKVCARCGVHIDSLRPEEPGHEG